MPDIMLIVVEGAIIKLLFYVLTSWHVAHSPFEMILIKPWIDASHPFDRYYMDKKPIRISSFIYIH